MTMSYGEVAKIIKEQIKRKGYDFEERKSTSTNSIYYKVYTTNASILFRVADHSTKSSVITLRIDRKINANIVKGFVENRIKGLGKRTLKSFLNIY